MFKRLTQKPSSLQARIVSGSVVLLSGSGLAAAINFGYNIAVAQFLGPKGFGHATAVYTLLTLTSAVTLSFQLISAKVVAQQASPEGKSAGYRSLHRQAWACGVIAALVLLLFQRRLSDFLNLPGPSLIALIAIGAAFYIPLGSRRGYLQGAYGFRRLATNVVIEGAIRLGGSILLVLLGFGVRGVIAANSVAVAVAYFAIVPRLPKHIQDPLHFSTARRELLLAVAFFAGQVLINNSGIVLVKHFFLARDAGLYAAAAMVGRVISTFSSSIVNSMVPLVAGSREEDRRDFRVIATALALVLGFGSAIAIVLRFMPPAVWATFFGARFEIPGPYTLSYLFALYAITTVMYSLSAVIITFEMSYKIANTSWIQLSFSGLVIAGICLFHTSLRQVIVVQFVLMSALLLMVAVPFVIGSLTGSGTLEPTGTFQPLRLVRSVSEDEVISEFLKSDFHRPIFQNYQEDLRELVFQPDLENARENEQRRALFFIRNNSLWDEIPAGTEWHEVHVRQVDLAQIRVFPRAQWRRIGKGNYRIDDIVERFRDHEGIVGEQFRAKITAIRELILHDSRQLRPVILIGVSNSGPLTILDGNHRLLASLCGPTDEVESLRFLCGLSPKMKECCWYNTNPATLFRYGSNVLKNSMRKPTADLERILRDPEAATQRSVAATEGGAIETSTGGDVDLSISKRSVMVKRMPDRLRGREEQIFLHEVQKCVEVDRPRIVLDCSSVRQLDRPVARLLLRCLEEAMKRNGDVKLAALPEGAETVLEVTGLNRIFETYGTVAEAENSFHPHAALHECVAAGPELGSESAA